MNTKTTLLIKQRIRRKNNNNAYTKKYEKTINGFTVRMYRNMLSRVTGVQYKKSHLYLGLPILDKEEFYQWIRTNDEFLKLFQEWKLSGYNRRLTPTVDRINPDKGYELFNMRIVTHSFNSSNIRRC